MRIQDLPLLSAFLVVPNKGVCTLFIDLEGASKVKLKRVKLRNGMNNIYLKKSFFLTP